MDLKKRGISQTTNEQSQKKFGIIAIPSVLENRQQLFRLIFSLAKWKNI